MDMAGTRLDSMAVKRLAKQFGYSEIRFHHVSPFNFAKDSSGRSKDAKCPKGEATPKFWRVCSCPNCS